MTNKCGLLLSRIIITTFLVFNVQCLNPEAYCLSTPSINEITDIPRNEAEVLSAEALDRCLPLYYEQMKLMKECIKKKNYEELKKCMQRIRNKTKLEFSHHVVVNVGQYIAGDLLVTGALSVSTAKFLTKTELLEIVEQFENAVEELLKLKENNLLAKVKDAKVRSGVIDSSILLNANTPLSSL